MISVTNIIVFICILIVVGGIFILLFRLVCGDWCLECTRECGTDFRRLSNCYSNTWWWVCCPLPEVEQATSSYTYEIRRDCFTVTMIPLQTDDPIRNDEVTVDQLV